MDSIHFNMNAIKHIREKYLNLIAQINNDNIRNNKNKNDKLEIKEAKYHNCQNKIQVLLRHKHRKTQIHKKIKHKTKRYMLGIVVVTVMAGYGKENTYSSI